MRLIQPQRWGSHTPPCRSQSASSSHGNRPAGKKVEVDVLAVSVSVELAVVEVMVI